MEDLSKTLEVPPSKVRRILSRHILTDGLDIIVDMKRSRGSYLVDARTKRKYLDMFSYFSSLPIGHNHPMMHSREFLEELKEAALEKPSNSDIYTDHFASFVEAFCTIAKPDYMKHLFFISGGALAVENALKTSFDWKVRKNLKRGGKELGYKVIHFREAFHGRSGYTLSLTNTDPMKIKYFPKFSWPRIINPKLRFPATAEVVREVEKDEEKAYSQIDSAFKKYRNDIACLIIEPIQGEGGDNHFRPEFLQELGKVCREKDIMFILDEIQTGLGTTGRMWAYQHFGIRPDIICFGKKTQVCGIMVSRHVDEIQENVFHVSSRINSTWGGNLTDMVRAKRYLEIIREEGLVRNAEKVGGYLLRGLEDLQARHPDTLSNARGRGFFIAIDLPHREMRDHFIRRCFENGLVILPCGQSSVRFRPPLDFSKEEADECIRILDKSLKRLKP